MSPFFLEKLCIVGIMAWRMPYKIGSGIALMIYAGTNVIDENHPIGLTISSRTCQPFFRERHFPLLNHDLLSVLDINAFRIRLSTPLPTVEGEPLVDWSLRLAVYHLNARGNNRGVIGRRER